MKKTKSGSAGGQVPTSTWPFFELLYFLKEEMTPTRTSSNLGNSSSVQSLGFQEEETQETHLSEQDNDQDIVDLDESVDSNSNVTRGDSNSNMTRGETSSQSVSSLSDKYVRKRKSDVQYDVTQKMLLLEEKKIEMLKNDKQEQCEDYHFLMSLLPHFKDMPPLQKLTLRNRITQAIIDSKNQCQQSSSFMTFNYNEDSGASSGSSQSYQHFNTNNPPQY